MTGSAVALVQDVLLDSVVCTELHHTERTDAVASH
jgi:hypothetical protein